MLPWVPGKLILGVEGRDLHQWKKKYLGVFRVKSSVLPLPNTWGKLLSFSVDEICKHGKITPSLTELWGRTDGEGC